MIRTRQDAIDLGAAWEQNAETFIDWARKPGHDSYWRFHRDAFLEIVPEAGTWTLDLGCGEGRLSRDLTALGHRDPGRRRGVPRCSASLDGQARHCHLSDAGT
jgi:hypothetical protein